MRIFLVVLVSPPRFRGGCYVPAKPGPVRNTNRLFGCIMRQRECHERRARGKGSLGFQWLAKRVDRRMTRWKVLLAFVAAALVVLAVPAASYEGPFTARASNGGHDEPARFSVYRGC